ncbi:MAG: hypothetical protein K9M84_10150 [Spirochaetia bacterium]|nr:hypothetical protein [Spirochaetia bacterium]
MIQTATAHTERSQHTDGFIRIEDELWYRIAAYSDMEPFFMSIISPDDLWMYISSTGGLTAGRAEADSAIFPYYTHDRVTENHTNTGSHTMIRVSEGSRTIVWEPFASFVPQQEGVERILYKHAAGNRIRFVERNTRLGLQFSYCWSSSPSWGWVRSVALENLDGSSKQITILDGVRNLLPSFVSKKLQNDLGNLVDAYKLNELHGSALALYGLSSRISDKAEASESLQVSTAWQQGLPSVQYLISERQCEQFRSTGGVTEEQRIEGRRGAYYAHSQFTLASGATQRWIMVLEVNQDQNRVYELLHELSDHPDELAGHVLQDITLATEQLRHIAGKTDGLQLVGSRTCSEHHYANTMFNTMRGGLFIDGYMIRISDVMDFVRTHSRTTFERHRSLFEVLPAELSWVELKEHLLGSQQSDRADLQRIMHTYLPLAFSRRHGDPSRPWNTFSIRLKNPDGTPRYYYEGNWRDIFQNWEPLAFSYPLFLENMISVCVNGITADGYNPYRVIRDGFAWERPDENDPWANIGYWGDHQVIYLAKLLEAAHRLIPQTLLQLLDDRRFTFVQVPYTIRPFAELMQDPFDSIVFDSELDDSLSTACSTEGSDGMLLRDRTGRILQVSLIEKLLIILLVKTTNLVPDGGIWMNTQRPEWNDANNALAGRGLSMVTLYYMMRSIGLIETLLGTSRPLQEQGLRINRQIADFLERVISALEAHLPVLHAGFSPKQRMDFVTDLGTIGSDYRTALYTQGLDGSDRLMGISAVSRYLGTLKTYLMRSISSGQRDDLLYHAYNVMLPGEDTITIGSLPLMLEGQVAVLSSGVLTSEEALGVLEALRTSELYREDQHSYLLYPRSHVGGFLERNTIEEQVIEGSPLLMSLLAQGDTSLVVRDLHGAVHFNGSLSCSDDLQQVLNGLSSDPRYAHLIPDEAAHLADLFEETFDHTSFTGRSGRMFAFEGNGSIYWHMVSKLLVAAGEQLEGARVQGADDQIIEALKVRYYDIQAGLGYRKDARGYGAFPMDPYSHSPWGSGARQPGMTGQVKEELLSRMGELGVRFCDGQLILDPFYIDQLEFLTGIEEFIWYDADQHYRTLVLEQGMLGFTVCQLPVIYHRGSCGASPLRITYADGTTADQSVCRLSQEDTVHLISRDGYISRLDLWIGTQKG